MWKRDDPAKPATPTPAGSAPTPVTTPSPAFDAPPTRPSAGNAQQGLEKTAVNIGKSVVIKGELNGSEDLTIEGQVEGKIELRQNALTIGPNGRIKAQVFAKTVIILGEVTGNVTATEKVDIRDNGSVDGDIAAPRVAIAEGAHFRGAIDMQRSGGKPGDSKPGDKTDVKPAAATTTPSGTTSGTPVGTTNTPAGATR